MQGGEKEKGLRLEKSSQERSLWIELFCITTVGRDSRVNSCVRTLTDTQSKTGNLSNTAEGTKANTWAVTLLHETLPLGTPG